MDNDHDGDDIGQGFSSGDAFDKCSVDPSCMGFNSNGWYKIASAPNMASPGVCLYEKARAGSFLGPFSYLAPPRSLAVRFVDFAAAEVTAGYAGIADMDFIRGGAGDIVGGGFNTCHDVACCKAQCDENPLCGVFMFGTVSWCTNCCWIKKRVTSTSSSGGAFIGAITYIKMAGYTSAINLDFVNDGAVDIVGGVENVNCVTSYVKAAGSFLGPFSYLAPPRSLAVRFVDFAAAEVTAGYAGIADMDFIRGGAGDIVGGGFNTCHDVACCKAQCDENPLCGVFMFGTVSWCTNCCWIKKRVTSTSSSGGAFIGAITYIKMAGYTSAINLDFVNDGAVDIVGGVENVSQAM
ncbi:hypothetical protein TSOC_000824 [Tetrabaena socialis]|uniref:Uncharacterized protein n=1 Tax=Tetrabaena socialis TaxID=47790 RepID=A0A2J8AIA0_9CHLO|nr:hypothetical protein TSOC_000824 [Tetrabaena socialis]|eukprot:PNH12242.1 hypothetical protein TSOC_000824 [Tetrabaena socialis]